MDVDTFPQAIGTMLPQDNLFTTAGTIGVHINGDSEQNSGSFSIGTFIVNSQITTPGYARISGGGNSSGGKYGLFMIGTVVNATDGINLGSSLNATANEGYLLSNDSLITNGPIYYY